MGQVSRVRAGWGRRRSQRVLMQVPVRNKGADAQGKPFEEFTETLAINAHGALVLLEARVTSISAPRKSRSATWRFSGPCAAERPKSAWNFPRRALPSGAFPSRRRTGARSIPRHEPAISPAESNCFLRRCVFLLALRFPGDFPRLCLLHQLPHFRGVPVPGVLTRGFNGGIPHIRGKLLVPVEGFQQAAQLAGITRILQNESVSSVIQAS